MEQDDFMRTFEEVLDTIESAVAQRKTTSSVFLLFSALNGFCGLLPDPPDDEREAFEAWVKKWMLRDGKLYCNEKELWEERCRILCSASRKKVPAAADTREIFYVYDESPRQGSKKKTALNVSLPLLLKAFNEAVHDYIGSLGNDLAAQRKFYENAQRYAVIAGDGVVKV